MKKLKIKSIVARLLGVLPAIAIAIGIASLQSSACLIHYYQPELPEELNAYRK